MQIAYFRKIYSKRSSVEEASFKRISLTFARAFGPCGAPAGDRGLICLISQDRSMR